MANTYKNNNALIIDFLSHNKEKDFLAMILSDDIISVDDALNIQIMKKNIQRVKEMHPHTIHHTDASGWFTNVDDPTQPNGLRKIRRSSEASFWDALVTWYLDNNINLTLQDVYGKWLEEKRTPKNAKNIERLEAAWKAYYINEPLSSKIISKPLRMITALELKEWAENLLRKHYPVDTKKFSRMFTITNQCFDFASDEDRHIVESNTWQKARKKINRDLIFRKALEPDEKQVFTDDERRAIREEVECDLIRYKKQASTAGLQILFLFEAGLRIGECCGLKWSDISGHYLQVNRQADNDGVREWTKTDSSRREIYLTDRALQILEDVKDFNREHHFTAEWIFQSANSDYDYPLSYNAADRKLRKLCNRIETITKSPHKCRKTCISALLDSPDINPRTAQRFAGHKDIRTTLTYYSYERKTKDQQAIAINKALAV